jgi:enoyl-CoA hydratase/carnithine racemase
MEKSSDARIVTEVKERVCYVTINRPEAKNALNRAMYGAIRDACVQAERDPGVDVVVLSGANGVFTTGGDLKEMLAVLEGDNPTAILNYEEYLPFETIRTMGKPTVACIDGLCLGGGLTLAFMCDILIASDRTRFAIPEAKVGIVDGHLPRLLRTSVPPARLRYWMYTGAFFPASEAYEAGLLTRVVPPDQMEAALQKVLSELKASSPEAIQTCKRILNETRPLSPMTDAFLTLLQPAVLQRLQQFNKR